MVPFANAALVGAVRNGCPMMLHSPGAFILRTRLTTGWQVGSVAAAIMHPTSSCSIVTDSARTSAGRSSYRVVHAHRHNCAVGPALAAITGTAYDRNWR